MMIERNIIHKLEQELSQPEILVLLGPRQVGKTTLLKELEEFARKKGHRTVFFDLEQPHVLADFNRSDSEIVKLIGESGDIIFIDEFQYVRNVSKIFKAIFDAKKKIKIICSGSSSLEIHKHLKESLAGRRFLYRIYPLEYAEIKKSDVGFKLGEYLRFGGMPGLYISGIARFSDPLSVFGVIAETIGLAPAANDLSIIAPRLLVVSSAPIPIRASLAPSMIRI